jgi:hypothetical protein
MMGQSSAKEAAPFRRVSLERLANYWTKFWLRPSFYLMKVLGRFTTVRNAAPRISNRRLTKPHLGERTLFPAVDAGEVATGVLRDGVHKGLDLPMEIVERVRGYAMREWAYGNADPRFGFRYPDKAMAQEKAGQRFVVAYHFNATSSCPEMRELERDPKLWQIAEQVLGTTPRHIGNQLWWSFAGEEAPAAVDLYGQQFHFDLDDYGFLKFFFYLTDVDESSGPHVCVRGSHRKKRLSDRLLYRRIPEREVISFYGRENIVMLCGKAGTGFAENTYCVHKGLTPRSRDRLILQIQFALNDYGVQHDVKDTALLQRLV